MSIQSILTPETQNENWSNIYVNNINTNNINFANSGTAGQVLTSNGDGTVSFQNPKKFQTLSYGGVLGGSDFADYYFKANASYNATGIITNPVSPSIQMIAPFNGKIIQASFLTQQGDTTTIISYGSFPVFDTFQLTGNRGVIQLNRSIFEGEIITIGFLGSTLTAGKNPANSFFQLLCRSD
jgi:hypothetical protein